MTDVTRILNAIEQGDGKAADELLPLVYEELRRLATKKMSMESPGQTLQPTALVHEAYIRLVGSEASNWNSRTHFFYAAAEAMRRILIDKARHKKSQRRGGDRHRVDLNNAVPMINETEELDDLITLNEALDKLSAKDKIKADLVKLRYFAGLSSKQAAEILDISHNTADKYWAYAHAWLSIEIGRNEKTCNQ
ncbi:MAG: ECF-type sigma factor [Planctomycetota bacterium]|jgi:RNA polymerase sigma factor (TIGR02999 family)